MTEMFGEAWSPMSVPDLAPDDDDDDCSQNSQSNLIRTTFMNAIIKTGKTLELVSTLHSRKAFSFT